MVRGAALAALRKPRNIFGPATARGPGPPGPRPEHLVSVLSLPTPGLPPAAPSFAPGSRRLAAPARPVSRATLAHHVAVVPLGPRALALVTGNAPGELAGDAALVRWAAARLRAVSARLVAGEESAAACRKELSGLLALGPDPAPAGEEMLVGLAAAGRRLATGRVLAEAAVAALQSALALAASDAPPAARRLLEDAAKGAFPEPLAALAERLGDPESEDAAVRDAAARLSSGGRPGIDALAGAVALARDVALGSV